MPKRTKICFNVFRMVWNKKNAQKKFHLTRVTVGGGGGPRWKGVTLSSVFFLNPSLNSQKNENLQWEMCKYITGREKTFSDTAQYFHLKHQNIDLSVMKNTFFNEMVFQGQKDFFQN